MQTNGFSARGGWWVAVQFPLLVLAYFIPVWTGREIGGDFFSVLRYGSLLLIGIGAVITFGGVVALGRWLTPFPQPLPKSKLRTGGAYALVRHPLYTGILIMTIGWSLYQASLTGLFFDAMLFLFFDRKAAREEIWLAEKFSGYTAYRGRVKKLIPWVY